MKKHNSVTLQLGVGKPDNVYRFIERWQLHPSRHSKDGSIYYLFIEAIVQWGPGRDYPEKIFSIVMQYSPEIGRNVDISQPAHIHADDIKSVMKEFMVFTDSIIQ